MAKFSVGDRVRIVKTGQSAKVVGIGSLALPREDRTVYNVMPDSGGPSVNLLPEEIEPIK